MEDFLFGEDSAFANPADLAREIVGLPNATYGNRKGVESLLSQIVRMKKPVPDALVIEICRAIERRGQAVDSSEVNRLARAHNAALREQRKRSEERNPRILLWESAHSGESPEHFCVLNRSGLSQNYGELYPVLQAHGAALGLLDPKHPRFMSLFEDLDLFGGSIWDLKEDSVSFTYLVPTTADGLEIFAALLRFACQQMRDPAEQKEIGPENIERFSRPVVEAAAARLDAACSPPKLKIRVLEEPWNSLCGVAVCAFGPRDAAKGAVFVLSGGEVLRMSDEESFSWSSLVYRARSQLLRHSKPLDWREAREVVVGEIDALG